jgi:superfamily II DNA or RNA helicase
MLLKITAAGLHKWEHQTEGLETMELSQKMGYERGLYIGPPGVGKTFVGFEHAMQTVQGYWEEGEKAQIFVLVPTKLIRKQKTDVLQEHYGPETLQKVKALKDIHPELDVFVTAVDDFDATALKQADVIISTYQFFNLHEHEIKENNLPVKYLIVDEASYSASPSYQRVINAFKPDYTLGLSIEDIKFEGKRAQELLESNRHLLPANRISEIESSGIIRLSDLYQGNLLVDMSSEENIRKFIEKNILADIRVKSIDYAVKDFATQSLSSKTEDYITTDENNERDFDTPKLYKDLNREKLNLDIYNDYMTKVPDYKKEKPAICTSLSIEHSEDLEKLFQSKGVAAKALHSKLSDKEQKAILESFERGEIKVLITVEMLKMGYDFPEVETILQNRPIYSRHTYINAVGRIWRYFVGKDYCLIIDRTWNFERYASHNMHTVFNRQYKYGDKEGERFFSTDSKDYLDKKEINYDFRNFLPVVDKKVEYALTGNQLNEWSIAKPHKEIKNIYSKLNESAANLKEVLMNGIVFYKKDLRGLTVWTIKLADKVKFIEAFALKPARDSYEIRNWDENYILVKQFLEKNGRLPKSHSDDEEEKRSGNWVSTQKQRIAGKRKEFRPFNEDELNKLKELGISKPKKIYSWEERYDQLKKFNETHERLPSSSKKDNQSLENQLAKWIIQVKKLVFKNKLSKAQIDLLKKIEFPFTSKQIKKPWEDSYLQLIEFINKNGHFPRQGRKETESARICYYTGSGI